MTTAQLRRSYRASLILDLRGSTDAPEAVIERLKDTLKSLDCKVTESENLGQKEFSRVVDRKFPSGLYVQFHFEGPVNTPTAFREKLRLDRTVNRLREARGSHLRRHRELRQAGRNHRQVLRQGLRYPRRRPPEARPVGGQEDRREAFAPRRCPGELHLYRWQGPGWRRGRFRSSCPRRQRHPGSVRRPGRRRRRPVLNISSPTL